METKRVASIGIAALTLILLISYFVVPVFEGIMEDPSGVKLTPGEDWTYEVHTNLPATVSIEGVPWLTVYGDTITGTVPEDGGTWTLTVIAESVDPIQKAVQTVTLTTTASTVDERTYTLVWLIPVLMALGTGVLVLRAFSTDGREPRERKERGQRSNIKVRRGRER